MLHQMKDRISKRDIIIVVPNQIHASSSTIPTA